MENKFLEELKCPICFGLPMKEVFQCQDGHTLCNECFEKLSNCPQCRIPYGDTPIRSRGLEAILDKVIIDCAYKSEGCTAKLTRKDIYGHVNNCNFGWATINICKVLGYKCGYTINPTKIEEAITHFQTVHAVQTVRCCVA